MPKYFSFQHAVEDNQSKPCSVSGCPRRRYKISKHCRYHKQKAWYHGHEEADRIKKQEYAIEVEEVSEIINLNPDHPGIQYGIAFLSNWMKAGNDGSTHVPCPDYLGRLYQAEVDTKDLLILIAALWLFAERQFGKRVKSDKHQIYMVGMKVIRFISYWGRTRGPDHREVGTYIKDNIGGLLLNIVKAVERKKAQRKQTMSVQYRELNIN